MNFLLDTHTLIWFVTGNPQLSKSLVSEIIKEDNVCFVSIASFWEIGIKHALDKISINKPLTEFFHSIESSAFRILPITPTHILQLVSLQFHHRDPFDRLLIAQAMVENLTVITKDHVFSSYDINVKWNNVA